MNATIAAVRDDFDRIAALPAATWSHNTHYHGWLLRHVPAGCRDALDIGCGTGDFSRLLAARAGRVVALDLSPRMIEVARERSRGVSNVQFQVADVMDWPWAAGQFDCIASIATFHHLPLEPMLRRAREALRPGGVLVVLDLYRADNWRDLPAVALALPASLLLKAVRLRRLRESREVRAAWAAHGAHDRYPALAEVRRACAAVLPGARLTRHLLWRYSIVWCRNP